MQKNNKIENVTINQVIFNAMANNNPVKYIEKLF
jgi:hypothetical protein